jgi:putative DNA primase/helicase
MRAADFAHRLRRVRRRGDWYDAICPAHSDRDASLSFSDGDKAILMTCHAGCSKEAVLRSLGLRWPDVFFNNEYSDRRPVARYPYHDEDGRLLYEVLRFEPKAFVVRRPDSNGRWVYNMGTTRRVLYRLPQLKGEQTVYVVEGEKDADSLTDLGIPATTPAWGAGAWRQAYTDQLLWAGVQRVVVLPDNDKAGEAYSEAVARACSMAGMAVKVVRLPGLPTGGDVTDWITAGGTVKELAEIVTSTKQYTVPTAVTV